MLLSLALVMEGMDVGLINNFFAHPAYLRKFGWPDKNGKQHISSAWQGGIGAGNNCGSIIGLLINGYLQARFGSRRVYMVCIFSANLWRSWIVANFLCRELWFSWDAPFSSSSSLVSYPRLREYSITHNRSQHRDDPRRKHYLRHPVGYFPNAHDGLRS